ncbi:MAG: tRNA uridine-5-carboxymethylaminomethyl(34) synthesis GTPase MnmE [Buchnera aphidicola (Nurudea shiraii)]
MILKNDTIVSRVTPLIRCNIGIIRISGPLTSKVSIKILGKIPLERHASYLPFFDIKGKILDHGIALWFPGPHSFTGEDSLELQGHGNPIILNLIISNILSIPNIRLSRPGEFSERAFLNGKIDLIQAESIADLINANSEKAAYAALNSLQGVFSSYINKLIDKIKKFRIIIETYINFSEHETDLNFKCDIEKEINTLISFLKNILKKSIQTFILHESIKIVICGAPNSGKSSLLNSLSKTNRAIVTNIPGTTRDIIYANVDIKGISFNLVDTAGLRLTEDLIERIGIQLAWKEINSADHVFFIIDGTSTFHDQIKNYTNFTKFISNEINVTIIFNKLDLDNFRVNFEYFKNKNYMSVSVLTNQGIEKLRDHLCNIFKIDEFFSNNENIFLARQRHINILKEVLNHIRKSKKYWKNFFNIELLAEDLRICQDKLNLITGSYTTDQLLTDIFSSFCIGK